MKPRSFKLSRSAMATALSVVILYISSLLPSGQLAGVCVASVCVVFVSMRCGWKWACGCYTASAFLALLLVPQKGMALSYALFLGYYPLIKLSTERISRLEIRWILRLVVFNLILFLASCTGLRGLLPVVSTYEGVGLLLFVAANGAFVIYDYALTQVILIYLRKIDGRI